MSTRGLVILIGTSCSPSMGNDRSANRGSTRQVSWGGSGIFRLYGVVGLERFELGGWVGRERGASMRLLWLTCQVCCSGKSIHSLTHVLSGIAALDFLRE
jgi:hypothetical protein